MKKNKSSNSHLRHLSQAEFLEESVYPPLMRRTIILVALVIIGLVIWSSVSRISEVAIASGEVVPGDYIQLIQHLEGGIIADINVKEGEIVHDGQTLATLDGLNFKKDLSRLKLRQLTLELQAERLSAFVHNSLPEFDKITSDYEKLKNEQLGMFASMSQSRDSAIEVVEKQINQKKEAINSLKDKQQTLKDSIALLQQEYNMKEKLVAKGAISKVAFLDISKELNELKGKLDEAKSAIVQMNGSIAEFNNRIESLEAQYKESAYTKLEEVKAQLAENNETVEKLTDKVERLQIKSPVNGLVKKIEVTTVGGVISPGQPIMEILPVDENVIVEVKIKPSDIGHIKLGQVADIRVSSFDFSRYGGVKGKLDYISATTFENKDGNKYYVGRVNLTKNYVGNNQNDNIIVPGMTVQANIITGDKTILSYLLKPIKASIDSALSER